VGRVDQADDPVLDEVAQVDGVRHGRGHAAGQRLDEGNAGLDARVGAGRHLVGWRHDEGRLCHCRFFGHRGHLKNLRCLP